MFEFNICEIVLAKPKKVVLLETNTASAMLYLDILELDMEIILILVSFGDFLFQILVGSKRVIRLAPKFDFRNK